MHNGLHYDILVYIDDMFNHIHTHKFLYAESQNGLHRMGLEHLQKAGVFLKAVSP